jgi:hypothetical protein
MGVTLPRITLAIRTRMHPGNRHIESRILQPHMVLSIKKEIL